MSEEKRKLSIHIHKLKGEGCITSKELYNMYKTPLELEQLMLNHTETMKHIKTFVVGRENSFNVWYTKDYSRFKENHKAKLCKVLGIDIKELQGILDRDINRQNEKK